MQGTRIKVYQYEIYNRQSRVWERQREYATEFAIRELGGMVVYQSVMLVDSSRVNQHGVLFRT